MASTSVHLPDTLVERLDQLAAERGVSRNRVIVQACEKLLSERETDWPRGFFEAPLPKDDLALLRSAGQELEQAVYAARRERPVPLL